MTARRRARPARSGPKCSGLSPWISGARARRSGARPADCGTEVKLYLRAKIGSCNCTTGVADDEELDRMSDFDLVGGEVSPLGAGRPITIAWMKGRSRAYTLAGSQSAGKTALSVAFNDRCDMVVATVVLLHDRPAMIEPGVHRVPERQYGAALGRGHARLISVSPPIRLIGSKVRFGSILLKKSTLLALSSWRGARIVSGFLLRFSEKARPWPPSWTSCASMDLSKVKTLQSFLRDLVLGKRSLPNSPRQS